MDCSSDIDVQAHSSLRISTKNHENGFTLSLASSPTSSTSSVFSLDAPSSQSSVSSASSSWDSENDASYPLSQAVAQQPVPYGTVYSAATIVHEAKPTVVHVNSSGAVAFESRQHPRRTQPQTHSDERSTSIVPRPPPSLVRQSERKDNFVDSLVDTTTQMIETIWPLSVLSCGRDTSTEGKNQNLIGLRTFVQEVLRRSRTSYSTLQVALYYLILIQSCLPRHDFTMEQHEDSPACRAMQCGRRMFLASLILASKYLQDRNYSARAWSKISGLKACEINANEIAFLTAVHWKLHIPEPVFQRWTDVVLKYSPSASSPSSSRSSPCANNMWKAIIPRLTPALDTIDLGHAELAPKPGLSKSPVTCGGEHGPHSEAADRSNFVTQPHICTTQPTGNTTTGAGDKAHLSLATKFRGLNWSTSNQSTPTNTSKIPRTLEPTPRATRVEENNLPALPRLGPLPTPKLTPRPTGFITTFSTPAVGAEGLCPRRSSMSLAMEQVHSAFPTSARRSSLGISSSSASSPESMISDVSSRSSRSSSISSVASSMCAPPLSRPGGLAAQATRRCANMQLSGIKEIQAPTHAVVLKSPEDDQLTWEAFRASQPISASPCRLAEYESNYIATPVQPGLMNCTVSAHEAATVLQALALNHQARHAQPTSRPKQCRKRDRPLSMDLGTQDSVRDLITPRYLAELPNGIRTNEDDSMVLPDGKVADSFLVPKAVKCQVNGGSKEYKPQPMLAKEEPRKRTCGNAVKQEAYRAGRLIDERAMQPRPGMWEGII
ncbi:MAG: hypothetical protein Q9213_000488 [Squamulea squamosa]